MSKIDPFEGVMTENSISEEIGKSSEDAIKLAAENNWEVVFPSDQALQIDIDSAEAYQTYTRHYSILQAVFGVESVNENPSKSGKAWRKHITVRLKQVVTPERRILLQAVMGSDRMRELLSLARLLRGDKTPALFFEKKL